MYNKIFNWQNPEKNNPFCYFQLFRKGINDILLESTRVGKNGRFSYIALDPEVVVKYKDQNVLVNNAPQKGNPLRIIKGLLRTAKDRKPNNFPLFYGGAIGYIGYDIKNIIEPKLKTQAKRDTNFPDMYMIFPRVVIAFDHLDKKIYFNAKENTELDIKKVESILKRDYNSVGIKERKERLFNKNREYNIVTNISFKEYARLFDRAKEYISSGDTFQVKISIRHELDLDEEPLSVYRRLRTSNPSPYSAFLDLEDMVLVSCSPEELFRLEGKVLETRPIGGTYPRGSKGEEDNKIAISFYHDKKEIAEHIMLIDLERNDLGRVCKAGSVKVIKKMALEKYTNLMHIVTTIRGEMDFQKDSFDVIKSMFPGGTVTGCPKIRAMEIIDELEPVSRGPYTGSIGFITPADEAQFNIIIRTLMVDKARKKGYVQVGGGIVADSEAEYEYKENLRKGKAIIDAIYNQ